MLDFERKFWSVQFYAKSDKNCVSTIFDNFSKSNFSGINLKWKTLLLLILIFHRKPNIGQDSGSWVMDQNAHKQSKSQGSLKWNIS